MHVRTEVRDSIAVHLRYKSTRATSRIKRFKGLIRPQFRLMVGDVRVFYDVAEDVAEILAIILKSETESWLQVRGERK